MGFNIENNILKSYNGSTSDVIIPSCVTEIGKEAFKENSSLESVILTGNVKKIGCNAFDNCINLKKVIIPDSVTKIGNNAFDGTKWLKNKQVSEKDAVIVNGIAIAKADNIGETVNLEGIKEIQSEIFKDCNQIKKFIISDGVKICNDAFFNRNDFNICLKDNNTSVNIPVKKKEHERYRVSGHEFSMRFNARTQRLFDFIGADMEHKESLFNNIGIPEYRYPLAVFMANAYESEFFRIFVDMHKEKITEYAEKNAPDLLKFIGGKD